MYRELFEEQCQHFSKTLFGKIRDQNKGKCGKEGYKRTIISHPIHMSIYSFSIGKHFYLEERVFASCKGKAYHLYSCQHLADIVGIENLVGCHIDPDFVIVCPWKALKQDCFNLRRGRLVIPIVEERGWITIFVPSAGPDALADFKAPYPDEKYPGNILYPKFSDSHSILRNLLGPFSVQPM